MLKSRAAAFDAVVDSLAQLSPPPMPLLQRMLAFFPPLLVQEEGEPAADGDGAAVASVAVDDVERSAVIALWRFALRVDAPTLLRSALLRSLSCLPAFVCQSTDDTAAFAADVTAAAALAASRLPHLRKRVTDALCTALRPSVDALLQLLRTRAEEREEGEEKDKEDGDFSTLLACPSLPVLTGILTGLSRCESLLLSADVVASLLDLLLQLLQLITAMRQACLDGGIDVSRAVHGRLFCLRRLLFAVAHRLASTQVDAPPSMGDEDVAACLCAKLPAWMELAETESLTQSSASVASLQLLAALALLDERHMTDVKAHVLELLPLFTDADGVWQDFGRSILSTLLSLGAHSESTISQLATPLFELLLPPPLGVYEPHYFATVDATSLRDEAAYVLGQLLALEVSMTDADSYYLTKANQLASSIIGGLHKRPPAVGAVSDEDFAAVVALLTQLTCALKHSKLTQTVLEFLGSRFQSGSHVRDVMERLTEVVLQCGEQEQCVELFSTFLEMHQRHLWDMPVLVGEIPAQLQRLGNAVGPHEARRMRSDIFLLFVQVGRDVQRRAASLRTTVTSCAGVLGFLMPAVTALARPLGDGDEVKQELVVQYRNLWFFLVLFKFVRREVWPAEFFAHVQALASRTPTLLNRGGVSLETHLEHNAVLREGTTERNLEELRRSLAELLPEHSVAVSAFSFNKFIYLLTVYHLETLRALTCGSFIPMFDYLSNGDIDASDMRGAVEGIADHVFSVYLDSMQQMGATPLRQATLVRHLQFLLTRFCSRFENERAVAQRYMVRMLDQFPQLAWNTSCLGTLLDIVQAVTDACDVSYESDDDEGSDGEDGGAAVAALDSAGSSSGGGGGSGARSRGVALAGCPFPLDLVEKLDVLGKLLTELSAFARSWIGDAASSVPALMLHVLHDYQAGCEAGLHHGMALALAAVADSKPSVPTLTGAVRMEFERGVELKARYLGEVEGMRAAHGLTHLPADEAAPGMKQLSEALMAQFDAIVARHAAAAAAAAATAAAAAASTDGASSSTDGGSGTADGGAGESKGEERSAGGAATASKRRSHRGRTHSRARHRTRTASSLHRLGGSGSSGSGSGRGGGFGSDELDGESAASELCKLLYRMTALLLRQYDDGLPVDEQLLHVIAWGPAYVYDITVARAAAFCWRWVHVRAATLSMPLLVSIKSAWLWCVQQRIGLFSSGVDAKEDSVRSPLLSPPARPEARAAVRRADSACQPAAHRVWLHYFAELFAHVRKGSTQQLRILFQMLSAAVCNRSLLSCRPNALGGRFQLLALALDVLQDETVEQPLSQAEASVLRGMREDIYDCGLRWFERLPSWYQLSAARGQLLPDMALLIHFCRMLRKDDAMRELDAGRLGDVAISDTASLAGSVAASVAEAGAAAGAASSSSSSAVASASGGRGTPSGSSLAALASSAGAGSGSGSAGLSVPRSVTIAAPSAAAPMFSSGGSTSSGSGRSMYDGSADGDGAGEYDSLSSLNSSSVAAELRKARSVRSRLSDGGTEWSSHHSLSGSEGDEARVATKQQLLQFLLGHELDRLAVWRNPLEATTVPALDGEAEFSTLSRRLPQLRTLVRQAFQISPPLALGMYHRFHQPAVRRTLEALLRESPGRAQELPDALLLLLTRRTLSAPLRTLHHLLYWAPVDFASLLRLMSRNTHTPLAFAHPLVAQYVLRCLSLYDGETSTFYLPQLVQAMRFDHHGIIQSFLYRKSQTSLLVSHRLLWQLQSESVADAGSGDEGASTDAHGFQSEVAGEDPLPALCSRLLDRIVSSYPPRMQELYESQFEFFEAVTEVSGFLMTVPRDKDAMRAAIKEQLAELELSDSLYLPTSPFKRVTGMDRLSGTPMQSAAKCPYLLVFYVQPFAGPEALLAGPLPPPKPESTKSACIFKVHDDCRQDLLALQVVELMQAIFRDIGLGLYLFPYKVIPTRTGKEKSCGGIIEVVPNTKSRDSMGKDTGNGLFDEFKRLYGREDGRRFQKARRNFIVSLAASAILCYILQIKDRHNGNVLYDEQGHVVHIDFGFLLGRSPGGDLGFETGAFKLTQEMLDVLGGSIEGEPFRHFVELTVKGFLACRQHLEQLLVVVEAMADSGLPCFWFDSCLSKLRARWVPTGDPLYAARHMRALTYDACNKLTTVLYDGVQALQNSIFM